MRFVQKWPFFPQTETVHCRRAHRGSFRICPAFSRRIMRCSRSSRSAAHMLPRTNAGEIIAKHNTIGTDHVDGPAIDILFRIRGAQVQVKTLAGPRHFQPMAMPQNDGRIEKQLINTTEHLDLIGRGTTQLPQVSGEGGMKIRDEQDPVHHFSRKPPYCRRQSRQTIASTPASHTVRTCFGG